MRWKLNHDVSVDAREVVEEANVVDEVSEGRVLVEGGEGAWEWICG